jgi:hypothetical protein
MISERDSMFETDAEVDPSYEELIEEQKKEAIDLLSDLIADIANENVFIMDMEKKQEIEKQSHHIRRGALKPQTGPTTLKIVYES